MNSGMRGQSRDLIWSSRALTSQSKVQYQRMTEGPLRISVHNVRYENAPCGNERQQTADERRDSNGEIERHAERLLGCKADQRDGAIICLGFTMRPANVLGLR